MDILKILTESPNELYPEDLDFFETELHTGAGYDLQYQTECQERINKIRAWMNGDISSPDEPLPEKTDPEPTKTSKGASDKVLVSLADLAPTEMNPVVADMSLEDIIFSEIEDIRKDKVYKTKFKDYVESNQSIDSAFVDKNHAFFEPWELDAIISVKQMDEAFLEKYFDALDHDKMARYQKFSEAFFMKHWADLDSDIVLTYGKNSWRKKENRSKQLDVFLRLKGVKK